MTAIVTVDTFEKRFFGNLNTCRVQYIVGAWWELVEEPARVVFTSPVRGLDGTVTLLVLTTANCSHAKLPEEGEVYEVITPDTREREAFFEQLFFPTDSTTTIP